MFAVVRTGGKQYRVAAGDKIAVEKLAGEAGEALAALRHPGDDPVRSAPAADDRAHGTGLRRLWNIKQ